MVFQYEQKILIARQFGSWLWHIKSVGDKLELVKRYYETDKSLQFGKCFQFSKSIIILIHVLTVLIW